MKLKLRSQLVLFQLPCRTGYCWNDDVMTLVTKPTPLPPPCDEKWCGRAPSCAAFTVTKWSEGQLHVVSVHAKSGGERPTSDDVSMIGRAVQQLYGDKLPPNAKGDTGADTGSSFSLLIIGDFNLDPAQVAKHLPGFRKAFGEEEPTTKYMALQRHRPRECRWPCIRLGLFLVERDEQLNQSKGVRHAAIETGTRGDV